MATPFLVSYDDVLTDILTDYKNLDVAPDVSIGSPVFIKGAVLASAVWGLYKYQDYLANQSFPDTADTVNLNHWGKIFGITRTSDDTDSTYVTKILNALSQPAAGGNAKDYHDWAMAAVTVDNPINANTPTDFSPSAVLVGPNKINVTQDWVDQDTVQFTTTGTLPSPLQLNTDYIVTRISAVQISVNSIALLDQGTGVHTITSQSTSTFYVKDAIVLGNQFSYKNNAIVSNAVPPIAAGNVIIIFIPNDEGILDPTSPSYIYNTAATQLKNLIFTYVDLRRPITATSTIVAPEILDKITITMTVTPANADIALITTDIENYVNSLSPGDTLYVDQLKAIAFRDGAITVPAISPSTDTVEPYTQSARFETVTITAQGI